MTKISIEKSEEVVDLVESKLSDSPLSGLMLIVGDKWYEQYPEKILGVPYESSGRFGKVIKYKGDINAVQKIDVPLDFIGNSKALIDPLASISSKSNLSAELLKPEIEQLVTNAISNTDKDISKIRKRKNKQVDEDAVVMPIGEVKSFKETFLETKGNITLEEVEVYVWYKTNIGKPLSKYYVSLFKPDMFSPDEDMTETMKYNVASHVVDDWVKDGLLFYYGGQLLPSVEYLQGDIYDKKIKLTQDYEHIKSYYGESVYLRQEETLKSAFQSVYDRRLMIGDGDRGLVLLPISKFAKNFMISTIESIIDRDNGKFKIKEIKRSGEDYGKPDIIGDVGVSQWKKKEYEEISLVDAFKWWMINKNPELKEPISYLEIINYYVDGKNMPSLRNKDYMTEREISDFKAKNEKLKSSTQREGERLFGVFLQTELTSADKVRIETEWNVTNNNYLAPDYNRIPVGFRMMKDERIRQEKRDAVAFTLNNGTGILSYDVGVGKTPSAIFTISAFIDAGYSKRPLVVVPNQVYKQFITEIKRFAPHIPVNEAYNFSEEYVENFKNKDGVITPPPKGTITIMTYEGFENIGFSEETRYSVLSELYDILNQGGESLKSEKQKASFFERLEMLMGKGLAKSIFNIEDLGFDFICYDEAHKMKKVFTSVKGESEEDSKGNVSRGKNPYLINSGTPSSIALRGFMINQYILRNNGYKNVLLLTATPFTNSPLEIFSMLAMVAYESLLKSDMNNLKTFFDTYVKASTELVINSKLKPSFKQVILGFNNIISLRTLIRRFILYKTGEEVGVLRPKKIVLPYLKEIENGVTMLLSDERKVETYLPMTKKQKAMMEDIIAYVETGRALDIPLQDSEFDEVDADSEEEDKDKTDSVETDLESLDETQKVGVRTITGLNHARNLSLSPYLYSFSGMKNPTYKEYIETSPKLTYVLEAIRSVKKYHESKNEPVSGQVIYMDRGIQYFGLIKEYLVKEIGYKPHEVGIIKSGLPTTGITSKEYVKNLFNGEIYNEKTKEFEPVPDSDRIKVVIGSSTIKEGINLQKYGTVLYNCFIDWNPTDIQQLEGRIWRQGNRYNSVRIVNPLVIDSSDIFIFQKLQEKTSRLNSIWATDGKTNVLDTNEFSPEELKYALIKDPKVIAELRIIEKTAKIESEILGFDRQKEQVSNIVNSSYNIMDRFNTLLGSLLVYRDFEQSGDFLADAVRLVSSFNDAYKKDTDKLGKKIYNQWEKRNLSEEKIKEASELTDKLNKPYWFTDFAVSVRDLKKFKTSYLDPMGIDVDYSDIQKSLGGFLESISKSISELQDAKSKINSEEYKNHVISEVVEEKETQKVTYTTLEQSIKNFNRLNYLLSDVKIPQSSTIERFTSCPPLNKDGSRAIDEEAISYLEKCLATQPQTKSLYFTESDGYTEERQKLHDKILNDVFDDVRCVKNDDPIAIFTGGAPASGKSSFINKNAKYLKNDSIFHLDADEIRAMLPEYQGWNANSTHLETQDIVNNILDRLGDGKCRYDFIYDGTMNKAKKYFSIIKKVKDMGYKTYIVFMDIPYKEARKRALERYQRSGRFVPMQVIDDFFTDVNGESRGQAALNELKSLVDGYIVADGITGEIKGKGGDGLPQSRDVSVYGDKLIEESEITKQDIQDTLNALKLQKKYTTDKAELDDINSTIKALTLYLKTM